MGQRAGARTAKGDEGRSSLADKLHPLNGTKKKLADAERSTMSRVRS